MVAYINKWMILYIDVLIWHGQLKALKDFYVNLKSILLTKVNDFFAKDLSFIYFEMSCYHW